MHIKVLDGLTAAALVEPHYQRNDFPSVQVRTTDVLIIAFDEMQNVLGCMRYCVEEGFPLLRTMAVDEPHRNRGIGKVLLQSFAEYLEANDVNGAHLICSSRLNPFYAQIGFERIDFSVAPHFLQERMKHYDPELAKMTCMRRP